MNGIYFKEVLIADICQEKAKCVVFTEGLNVITSTENHVGKSSLVKSLYYCLGAEVEFDGTWDKNSKLYIVHFSVNGSDYTISRLQKKFLIFQNDILVCFCQSISKELAPALEKIFDFSIYLPGKHSKRHELAPPVFTYLPYYIDQDKGWGTEPYESFSSLDQYKKEDRIKSLYYHLAVYTKWSVDIQSKIDNDKDQIAEIDSWAGRLQTTLETLLPEVENIIPAETIKELERGLALPKEKVEAIVRQIGMSRSRIQSLQSTLSQHNHQLTVILEYRKLKKLEPEQKRKTISVCPQCGYDFDDELYQFVREMYSEQNEGFMIQQIQLIVFATEAKLNQEKQIYLGLMDQLKKEENRTSQTQDTYDTYIKQRGLADSIRSLELQFEKCLSDKLALEEEIKNHRKKLRDLPNKKIIDEKYINDTQSNIMQLGAWDSDYDGKIGLLKPLRGQGTLASKIILSQYIALFSTMDAFHLDNLRFPFVVDSPRSKEPSKKSSEEIINIILEITSLPQIILVTMDFDDFDVNRKDNVHIIRLSETKALLNSLEYDNNRDYIENILGLFNDMQK